MDKKSKRIISYLILFFLLTISLTGCSNKSENEVIQDKIKSEISYLDANLNDMLNKANGITIQNYIVTAEEVKEEKDSSSEQGSSSSQTSENSESSNNTSSEQESDQSQSESSGSGSQSGENKVQYKMEENGILLQDRTPNWERLKSDVEKIYSDWSTIEIDLYKANINNEDILNFGKDLDIATQAIKSEDKQKTLESLAKLYSYLPKYSNGLSDNSKMVNLYQTKSNILNAYSIVELDNFTKIEDELKNAEQSFMPFINDMTTASNNQSNINKAYISMKELQNFLNNHDKEIFYIKYKNLMEELNNIL